MSKVFITQDNGKLDFSKAKRFGELVPMVAGEVFPDNSDERVHEVSSIVQSILRAFDPNTDYILLTGDPVTIAITCLNLGALGYDPISFLKWDRENKEYYPVQL